MECEYNRNEQPTNSSYDRELDLMADFVRLTNIINFVRDFAAKERDISARQTKELRKAKSYDHARSCEAYSKAMSKVVSKIDELKGVINDGQ